MPHQNVVCTNAPNIDKSDQVINKNVSEGIPKGERHTMPKTSRAARKEFGTVGSNEWTLRKQQKVVTS